MWLGSLWWLFVLGLLVAILCLVAIKFRKPASGKRGRRGVTGPTGAGIARIGATAQIPYALGMPVGSSIGGGFATIGAFGGENAFDSFLPTPIDPIGRTDTVRLLNSFAWAAIKPGTLSDLQVTFPTGDISATGSTMTAQVWQSPACNGTWTGTALIATHTFGLDGASFCMSNNIDTVQFNAGDRIALVYSLDNGTWSPTASQIPDGISAGLGYSFS